MTGPASAPSPRPVVSFIVIVLNGAATIRRCAESILGQAASVELLVVDNGSTDGTRAALGGLPLQILDEPVRRRGAARNRGLTAATGDYIAFVDADVELPAEWTTVALELLRRHPDVAGVGGPGETPEESWVARSLDALQYGHRTGDRERQVPSLATMDVLYRAESVRHERFLNLWAAEDPEFNFHLLDRGCRLLWSRELTVRHHHPLALGELVGKAFRYGMWFPAPYWHHPRQVSADVVLRLLYLPLAAGLAVTCAVLPAARPLAAAALLGWLLLPPASYAAVASTRGRLPAGTSLPRFILVHAARQYAQMAGIWAGVFAGTWREYATRRRPA